jgi:hypothetical protein
VRQLFRILSMSVLLLLTACATNVSPNFKFDPNPSTGLVVGSISYESANAAFTLYAKNTLSGKLFKLEGGCLPPCFFTSGDGRFTDEQPLGQRGYGYAVEVPAGDYLIAGWRASKASVIYHSVRSPDIPFKVEPGKVTYLGNLHFDPHWQDVQLRDRSFRDLAALRVTYPVLVSAPLAVTISDDVVIHRVGGGYTGYMNPPTIYGPARR